MVAPWWNGWIGVVSSLLAVAIGCGAAPDESAGAGGSAGAPSSDGGDAGAAGLLPAGGGAGGADSSACPSAPPAPEAGDVVDGDLTIATTADAESARSISEVTGSVVIARSFPGVLYLPNLQRVGGDVRLQGDSVEGPESDGWAALTELRLPNVEHIGGELYLYLTGLLVETDLRSLQNVGVSVYYMRNLALRRIGLDSLTAGAVSIQASPLAASCEIEAICSQVGAQGCGAQYSDPDCSCVDRCGRLEPSCDD